MRYVFVSNRLPFTITHTRSTPVFNPSSGGLSSALKSYVSTIKKTDPNTKYLWVGWPGESVEPTYQNTVNSIALKKHCSFPVYLNTQDIEQYYNGFCNKTLWPLFHYFSSLTSLNEEYWLAYQRVNTYFSETLSKIIREDDIILIQDYHLLLLPNLLREKGFTNPIGFFLHIPFPSVDLFTILPLAWQQKLLTGMLGANLIGFHTVSYQNNFLNSITALLGKKHSLGKIQTDTHTATTGVFPIGIDYEFFRTTSQTPEVTHLVHQIKRKYQDKKIIISVDRLDYSKEIYNRLKGYELLLRHNDNWRDRIVFLLTLVPSRSDIDTYQQTKKAIFKLIEHINTRFGTSKWTPIQYQYSSISTEKLLALYSVADMALITPVRDGMNLVAKEFVASRSKKDGVLVLSKFAGASHELSGAVFVNPYYPQGIANGIGHALRMNIHDQKYRMRNMQQTIQRYTINDWAYSFTTALQKSTHEKLAIPLKTSRKLFLEYENARTRLLLFDYDGTLVSLADTPKNAQPSSELLTLLYRLSQDPKNTLVIISGRDKHTLNAWLGWLPITISAEHGVWIKKPHDKDWKITHPLSSLWKESVMTLLKHYTTGLPQSFIEEKDYSLAFHHRLSPQKQAELRINQLEYELQTFLANSTLETLRGNKVIEIKPAAVNKGVAAFRILNQDKFDFILAAGDDTTDEDLFKVLPPEAYSIKIGDLISRAQLRMSHPERLLRLLDILSLKSEYSQQFPVISH